MKEWSPWDIKKLRLRFSLSQKTLANLLGVATNYVYLLEKGLRNPSRSLRLLLDCIEEKLKKRKEDI